MSIITVFYVGAIIYRLVLFRASNRPYTTEVVSDEEARAVPDDELPIYTVMIPAYREPEVINELIHRVTQFEYPPDRLDVKLLIEADDDVTIEAIQAGACPATSSNWCWSRRPSRGPSPRRSTTG